MESEKKVQKKMSHSGLISQALGLQISYFTLGDKFKAVSSSQIDRKVLITAGLAQSSSIIISFALEIALKGLLLLRINDFPKTHDLLKLYEKIDNSDRSEIDRIFKSKIGLSIRDVISSHKDMFIEFRYLEVEDEHPYNSGLMNEVLNSIVEYYNFIKNK